MDFSVVVEYFPRLLEGLGQYSISDDIHCAWWGFCFAYRFSADLSCGLD